MFKAILVDKDENGHAATLAEVDDGRLPEGDVSVHGVWIRTSRSR